MGSMLAVDMCVSANRLKKQPTSVPPLHLVDCPGIHNTSKTLLFNVEHLFFLGSPAALLLYLDGSKLIARRRPGTDDDVSSDEIGYNGCLAARYVYNVRHYS